MSQAIEETTAFGPLRITFDQRVLRPRAWTVHQSHWAQELLRGAPAGPVLELCTGAGQIGLLAVARSQRRLVCVDADPTACGFARRNALTAGLADRVEVREGRMEEVLAEDERFALVVADPPWVRRSETTRFPEDPLLAIDGGEDGLDLARTCLAVGRRHLMHGGSALVQLGTVDQVEQLVLPEDLTLGEVRSFERGVVARLDRR